MKIWIKKYYLAIVIPLVLIGVIVSIVASLINATKNWHSPLQYCLWEIQKHEGYDCDFTYYYQELEPKDEIRKEADKNCAIYCYCITCFTDDRKGEWFCFIEFETSSWFRAVAEQKGYDAEQCVLIDCDLAFESLYE